MRAASFALLLLACSDPSEPAHSTPPPPEPSPVERSSPTAAPMPTAPEEPPTTATPSTSTRAPRLAISAETSAEVRRLVGEARGLEHAGDHGGALARFDEALRLVPSQPRVLCEAGFIAHRAGDTALAGPRIDAALSVFGEPRHVSARLRVPLAMCLYNRGLVAEAEHDPRRAVEVLEASIALRPNPTVDAALARARAAVAGLPPTSAPAISDDSTVGGVTLTTDYTIATTDVATYERALRSGFRAVEWDGAYGPLSDTEVTRRPLATDGHPNVLVHIVTRGGLTSLVISWPLATGYQAQHLDLGQTADEGDAAERVEVSEVVGSWVGDVLRVDVTVLQHSSTRLFYAGEASDDARCEDGTDEDVTRSWTVVCRNDEFLECADLATRVESSGVTSYSWCDGSDDVEEHTDPSLSRAVIAADPGGITVSQVRDEAAVLGVEEARYGWDDVFIMADGIMLTEWVGDGDLGGD